MAVTRGIQLIGERASLTTPTFAVIQSMSVDDSTTDFTAASTTLSSPTNLLAMTVDITRVNQRIDHVATLTTADFNTKTVKRIALHNIESTSVTGTSTSLVSGFSNFSIPKTSNFVLVFTFKLEYTTN